MSMRYLLTMLFITWLCVPAYAGDPSASWEGLTGLFTQPTAEIQQEGDVAITFSEIRFIQGNHVAERSTIWYVESLTYVPFDRLELAVAYRKEVVRYRPLTQPNNDPSAQVDDKLILGHVKYIITPPELHKIGIAVGAMDITNETDTLSGVDVGRGRRIFLVGTYEWLTGGLSYQNNKLSWFGGARWSITDNLDLIAEYVKAPVFVEVIPPPTIDANFNLGMRFHPRQVPNLRVDMAAVGDGQFNLGFSFSYLTRF
ncbi:MAG: hypothetical protein ACYDBB_13505 [Armatimonadota bacterium]